MNHRKRYVVGQHVFSLEHQRAGQLLGLSNGQNRGMVRFFDTGEVTELALEALRVASWDEIRSAGNSTRLRRQDA